MSAPPPLVMVHGVFDNGKIFRAMRRYLEPRGIRCLAPSLTPSSGRTGMADLAGKLRAFIDAELGTTAPINLLGFSMGAVVSRVYLQDLDGRAHTRAFFSISAPYRGSQWAWVAWGRGAVELRPDSAFLARLEAGGRLLRGLTLHNYWTPLDLVIVPPQSSLWNLAENHRIWSPCHPCMLHDRRVMAHVHRVLLG